MNEDVLSDTLSVNTMSTGDLLSIQEILAVCLKPTCLLQFNECRNWIEADSYYFWCTQSCAKLPCAQHIATNVFGLLLLCDAHASGCSRLMQLVCFTRLQ